MKLRSGKTKHVPVTPAFDPSTLRYQVGDVLQTVHATRCPRFFEVVGVSKKMYTVVELKPDIKLVDSCNGFGAKNEFTPSTERIGKPFRLSTTQPKLRAMVCPNPSCWWYGFEEYSKPVLHYHTYAMFQ